MFMLTRLLSAIAVSDTDSFGMFASYPGCAMLRLIGLRNMSVLAERKNSRETTTTCVVEGGEEMQYAHACRPLAVSVFTT